MRSNAKQFILGIIAVLAFIVPSIVSAESETEDPGNFTVVYMGRVFDVGANQTTFTYLVSGTGVAPDLSHFNLEIPQCTPSLGIASFSPMNGVEIGTDPTTGIRGIKWDVPLLTTDARSYSITFAGEVAEREVRAAVKAGPGFFTVVVPGPSCDDPELRVQKFISIEEGIWVRAYAAPGLIVPLESEVFFRFIVTNTGSTALTNLALSDSVYDATSCAVPETLEPGAEFECIIGSFPAEEGQHSNTVTATALAGDEEVSASDTANYFGGEIEEAETPIIVIEGPVTAIINNIIVIFGLNIELDPNDPILSIIRIGDIVRVEGSTVGDGTTIIIVAIVVVIVVTEQPVTGTDPGNWTDNGSCANPPPPWAPAHGWRARCEGAPQPGGRGRRS